jgi:hypothetical protein
VAATLLKSTPDHRLRARGDQANVLQTMAAQMQHRRRGPPQWTQQVELALEEGRSTFGLQQ